MKKEEFDRKDGSKGYNYKPEVDDVVEAVADTIFSRENLIVKEGKAIKIMKYGLQVTLTSGEEVFLNLTDGQQKVIKKSEPLTGKTITFESYKNDFGQQVGARVK